MQAGEKNKPPQNKHMVTHAHMPTHAHVLYMLKHMHTLFTRQFIEKKGGTAAIFKRMSMTNGVQHPPADTTADICTCYTNLLHLGLSPERASTCTASTLHTMMRTLTHCRHKNSVFFFGCRAEIRACD